MRSSALPLFAALSISCATMPPPGVDLEPVTPEGAKAFVSRVNTELKEQWTHVSHVEWVLSTYITHDTEILSAKANQDVLGYAAKAI